MIKLMSLMIGLMLTAHAGPIFVGPGSGKSEYSLIFVRQNLQRFLDPCAGDSCHLDEEQKIVWQSLLVRAEKAPRATFQFFPREDRRLFGLDAGSNIVRFSQSEIWQDSDHTIAYDDAAAADVWLDVLAAVPPQLPPAVVAGLKSKLSVFWRSHLISSELKIDSRHTVRAIIFASDKEDDRIFIVDANGISFDLTLLVRRIEDCVDRPRTNFKISSLRWGSAEAIARSPILRLDSVRRYRCGNESRREPITLLFPIHQRPDGGLGLELDETRLFERAE